MKTHSLSPWYLRIKKTMATMMPIKTREPRIPPMTAAVDGPGVNSLFSSGGKRKRERDRKREGHKKTMSVYGHFRHKDDI